MLKQVDTLQNHLMIFRKQLVHFSDVFARQRLYDEPLVEGQQEPRAGSSRIVCSDWLAEAQGVL